MRLATFNIESLDLPPKAPLPLDARAAVLRPALDRLEADIVCLQEVNGQHVQGSKERQLVALDRLLEGTRHEHYERAVTSGPSGTGVADVHNLVTLSRFPISARGEIRHAHVQPLQHTMITGTAAPGREPVRFDRPLLTTRLDLPGGRALTVINVHLRAPLASAIPGEKSGHFTWRSVRGWAEGYYLSALKRAGQALELRLVVDELLAGALGALIAVAGDFNAEDHETPLRLAIGAEEDTGASELAAQSLVVLDRAIAQDRRWSVLHHGRPQMLDHILASHALYGRFRQIEVHNELLADEAVGFAKSIHAAASYHAPLVAQFDLGSN